MITAFFIRPTRRGLDGCYCWKTIRYSEAGWTTRDMYECRRRTLPIRGAVCVGNSLSGVSFPSPSLSRSSELRMASPESGTNYHDREAHADIKALGAGPRAPRPFGLADLRSAVGSSTDSLSLPLLIVSWWPLISSAGAAKLGRRHMSMSGLYRLVCRREKPPAEVVRLKSRAARPLMQ